MGGKSAGGAGVWSKQPENSKILKNQVHLGPEKPEYRSEAGKSGIQDGAKP